MVVHGQVCLLGVGVVLAAVRRLVTAGRRRRRRCTVGVVVLQVMEFGVVKLFDDFF